jgi:flagellar hook-associated protein 3 FlgL
MMRVSTASNYATMLANLTRAQVRQNEAGTQVASEKNATDLKGYAPQAEVLTAMRGVQTKVAGFLDQTAQLSGRLDMQEVALTRIADSTQGARTAIADALAADNGATLSQALNGFFSDAAAALNSRHDGRYLFAGGQSDIAPVASTNMASLAAPATVADQFLNDDMIISNRLDETATMETGFLASDLGDTLFSTMKAIRDYTDANGNFSNPLTDAQKTFLTTQLGQFDVAVDELTNATARNGLMQKRLESAREDLSGRAATLTNLIGEITDVDMPEAISRLQAAQVSVQAAAQVFQSLSGSSLLNILQP